MIDKNINKLSVGWKNQKLRRQTKMFWFVKMIKQRHAGSRLYAIGRQMSGVSGIKLSIMSSWILTRTTTRKSNEHLIKTFFSSLNCLIIYRKTRQWRLHNDIDWDFGTSFDFYLQLDSPQKTKLLISMGGELYISTGHLGL